MNGPSLFRIGLVVLLITLGAGMSTAQVYRIQVNDVLEVTVMNHAELSKRIVVPTDGHISYPLVGDVAVAGMTVAEFEETLRVGLVKYLVEPEVSILLGLYVKPVVHVMGAVKRPGTLDYTEGKTLIDYLGSAGGPTERANMKKVMVSRRDSTNVSSFEIDMNKVIKKGRTDLNIQLYPDDTVFVPESFFSGWRDYATLGSLLISSLTLYFVAQRWN